MHYFLLFNYIECQTFWTMTMTTATTTRSSPADEIANMNFLYDDIVHALQNTTEVHKFRHRSTPFNTIKTTKRRLMLANWQN